MFAKGSDFQSVRVDEHRLTEDGLYGDVHNNRLHQTGPRPDIHAVVTANLYVITIVCALCRVRVDEHRQTQDGLYGDVHNNRLHQAGP
ncbi:hypothetical protein J6590_048451 [Homalodisca vitripennis]|nr:hypothetical protein J6590_048451 [Homalodisca vitripennis]